MFFNNGVTAPGKTKPGTGWQLYQTYFLGGEKMTNPDLILSLVMLVVSITFLILSIFFPDDIQIGAFTASLFISLFFYGRHKKSDDNN
jgi:hypothetical protein